MEHLSVIVDGRRYRTATYSHADSKRFCIAERTSRGTLITEFTDTGMPLNQVYLRSLDSDHKLLEYLSERANAVASFSKGEYKPVTPVAKCSACSAERIFRELDLLDPAEIGDVPVVPIFRCASCGTRHYALTKQYLKELVKSNPDLFSTEELKEMEVDQGSFIDSLNQYVIRIFASKKIKRLEYGDFDAKHI